MKKDQERALNAFAAMESLPDSMLLEAEKALIAAEGGVIAPVKKPKSKGGFARFMSSGWTAAVLSGIVALAVLILVLRAGREPTAYPPPVQPAGRSITMSDHGADFTLSMEMEEYPDGTNRLTVVMTARSPGKRISSRGDWYLERITEEGAEPETVYYTEEVTISAKPARGEYATLTKTLLGTNTGGGFPAGTYRLHATEYDGEKYVSVAYCTFTVGEPDDVAPRPPKGSTIEMSDTEAPFTLATEQADYEVGTNRIVAVMIAKQKGEADFPYSRWHLERVTEEGCESIFTVGSPDDYVESGVDPNGYATRKERVFMTDETLTAGLYCLHAVKGSGEDYVSVAFCYFTVGGDDTRPTLDYPPAAEQTYTVTTPETLEYGATELPITVKAAEPGVDLMPHRKYSIVKLAGPANGEGADRLQTMEAVEVYPDGQNGGYAVYEDGLTLLNPEKWLPGLYRLYALNHNEEYVDYCDFVIKGDHGRSFELFVRDTVTTADPLISVQFISHRMGQPFGRGEKWDLYRIEDGRRTRMGGIAIESALEGLPVAPDEFAVDNDGVRISEVTNGRYQTLPVGDYELVFSPDSHSVTLPFTVVEDPDKQIISGTFLWVDGDPMLWDGGQYLPTHLLATEDVSFDGLTTGDHIEVIVGTIHETAPPTAYAYKIAAHVVGVEKAGLTEYVVWLAEMGYTVTAYPVATQTLTGYFLPNGPSGLLITDARGVIYLRLRAGYDISFDELTAGDRVEVTTWDTILESWPEQTDLYALRKLSDGDVSDIPADILAELEEAGWYQGDK